MPEAPDGDTLAGECTTGGDGTCTIEDLGWGTYYWFEAEAPSGYELPADCYSDMIVIDRDSAGGEFEVVEFEDPQTLTDLPVRKLDRSSEEPLAAASFELYLDDGDGVPEAPGGDTLIDDCTTGVDGICTVTGLAFGDYYWFETDAPPGYDLPENPYSVIITINAANAGTEITPIDFFDPRRPATLTVLKVDDVDDEPLAEAMFDLVRDDGDGVYETGEDTVVGTCVTNETGTCSVGDLDFGTYFWVETAAPTGYELPDDAVSDPVVVDAGNVDDVRAPVEFRDPQVPSELSVLKLDEADDTVLAGATFELYLDDGDGVTDAPDEGDVLVDECTTAEDGTCTIGDLGFGDYYWYETGAPEGYTIPGDATSDIITITAANAGTAMEPVAFHDPPVDEPTPPPTTPPTTPPEPELPKSGLSVSPWALGLGAVALITVGGGLLGVAGRRRVRGTGVSSGTA